MPSLSFRDGKRFWNALLTASSQNNHDGNQAGPDGQAGGLQSDLAISNIKQVRRSANVLLLRPPLQVG
jgi:hypothetical protein